ncbi:MAG TPA: C40 family peptidase [Rhodocyclaceae bacterium]
MTTPIKYPTPSHRVATLFVLAGLALALGLSACSSAPSRAGAVAGLSDRVAATAADTAAGLTGRPYRYGGASPSGFDCSGLVHYSYARAGQTVARSTDTLWRTSAPISLREIRRGDLLFFDQEGKKSSHLGIWLGDGRFVHAPSSGGKVRVDRLESDYWQRHFVAARRL